MQAVLGLEDGTTIIGEGFGVDGEVSGELVFTTQMGGYMEALTDASYAGQILMFTYPLIGNYGVDIQNFQHPRVEALGCVVREVCRYPGTGIPMEEYFEREGLLGIAGVDTRKLTINTRTRGTQRAALIVGERDPAIAVEKARSVAPISETDLIPLVSCREPYRIPGSGPRIAVLDLGIKKNIAVSLRSRGADIHVFPHDTPADVIVDLKPDALFITNGPGDPVRAAAPIQCVRDLLGTLPIFGICMGNQITALALGGETYKMKFGHRGTNQPVRHSNGTISITTQNHGFAVDGDSLPEGSEVSHVNVNDGTLEGFDDPYLDVTCVQFHPEAHGGPRDTENLFFDELVRRLA
ncbi:MAG: glutamine-hydrolyzing carbamoyl-phosphate synthase small subunit [Methanoculleaceae archaeon]